MGEGDQEYRAVLTSKAGRRVVEQVWRNNKHQTIGGEASGVSQSSLILAVDIGNVGGPQRSIIGSSIGVGGCRCGREDRSTVNPSLRKHKVEIQ